MSLNYKEIDALLQEADLDNSFIQEISQFDYHHLILQFYQPSRECLLLISLAPGTLRMHLTEKKRKALPKPPRFTAYLKSHIKGARLNHFRQLGGDRILEMRFSKGDARYRLYIKLWENNTNLILCDENMKILDCFTRRPKRDEIPGSTWKPQDYGNSPPPPMEIREFPGEGTLSRRVELYYRQEEQDSQRKKLLGEALPLLDNEIASLERRIARQKKQQKKGDSLRLKKQGDLIMAHLHELKKGDQWLDCTLDDGQIRIPLDPKLDPWANGEKYYKNYKKKKRQEEQSDSSAEKELLEQYKKQREKLQQVKQIDALKQWLEENRPKLQSRSKNVPEVKQPGLRFRSGAFDILVGRNARENDQLLRNYVRGNDTWLHCRDYSGGYVFIRGPKGKSIPLEILLDAANLAIKFSRAREEDQADLHYTQVKYLRRAKNGPRGLVIPTQEKNLMVKKDESRLNRLLDQGGNL